MIAKSDGVLVSQREEPSLVLLKQEIQGDQVIIKSGDGRKPLKLSVKFDASPTGQIVTGRVHTDEVKTVDCGDEAAKWFQDYLNRPDVRLLQCPFDSLDRTYKSNDPFLAKISKENQVNLQDLTPFHVVAQSSVDDLNTRTEVKISALNFRPNILIEESLPYDEDNWKYISFSSGAELVTLLPCGRCILTTNDPETGIKTNKEPLVSLRKYRMIKDKKLARSLRHSPCFGLSCSLLKPGNIKVGDDVFAVIQKGLFKY